MHKIFSEFSDEARRAVAAVDWSGEEDFPRLDFHGEPTRFCPVGVALVADARRLGCDRLFVRGAPTCPTANLAARTLWYSKEAFRDDPTRSMYDHPEYLRLYKAAFDFMLTFDHTPSRERNAYVQHACGVAVLIEPAAAATPTRTGAAAQEVPA